MKYYIKTFGCAANEADSERVAAYYEARGYKPARTMKSADDVVINTCMIRQSAEHRVYGLVHNLTEEKKLGRKIKIVVTGCMVGMAVREKTGKMIRSLKKKMPGVDEFLPIEEVGFDFAPIHTSAHHAWVPISNGCNNFCTFCVVPFTRGREVSRSMEDIISEVQELVEKGIASITLVGQNVNSYGADLQHKTGKVTYVKHLGRLRIPTLFPQLLERICKIKGVTLIDFISSNPWDFSDDLIEVIVKNEKISRHIHLPVQAGDNEVLKHMSRWYTREEYLTLISKLKAQISNVTISTDIIVGFPGETKEQFEKTVDLAQKVGFSKAYIAMYSDRPMTAAHNVMKDDVPFAEKKRRWQVLEELINQTNLRLGTYQ
jgi:tRNA-2-methylthio-N6-dimethylallyladenosine synthase